MASCPLTRPSATLSPSDGARGGVRGGLIAFTNYQRQLISLMNKRVRVGLIGSQFITTIHAESLHRCADAELFAVASPTKGHAQAFAKKAGIPHHFTDYRKMLAMDELD